MAIIASFIAVTLFSCVSGSFARQLPVTHASSGESRSRDSGRIGASSPSLSGISVAVLNEAVSPSYFSGSLQNDYSSMVSALSAEGATTTSVTSSQITSGVLSGYDMFVMIDNAPTAACQASIRNAWMAGTAIMAFDSSICALTYFGILPSTAFGSNGQGTYWEYGNTAMSRVARAHPITVDFNVNAAVTGTSGDAMWLSNTMSGMSEFSRITVLTTLDGDTSRWTTVLYEPVSYAPVFFCWEQEHVKNSVMKPMILQAVKYLATSGNSAPVLTSGFVNPMAGTTTSSFTYMVTYTDAENTAPSYIVVFVDGINFSLYKQSGSNYRDGCVYGVTAGGFFTTGSHAFHFEASDGQSVTTTPTETGPFVNITPPTFYLTKSTITPTGGFLYTMFTFKVTYTHTGNVGPSTIYATIDSVSYPMSKVSSYDYTFSDGCEFQYSTTLAAGSHAYSFGASYGATTNTSPTYTGLFVAPVASAITLTQASVSPSSGDTNTNFQFRLLYTQAYNLAPTSIWIYLDEVPYSMSKESSWDTDYDDGCYYIYSTRLSLGIHTFYFSASCSGSSVISGGGVIDVQVGSASSDPASIFTVIIIAVGSVATISTVSIAYKIKVKKAFTSPVYSNPTTASRQQAQPGNARAWSSGSFPAQSGGGVAAGGLGTITPGFLPPSAFVSQPVVLPPVGPNDPQPQTPQNRAFSAAGHGLGSSSPSAPDSILPGSPKWMRLAQFDISMYTAPPVDDDVTLPDIEGEHQETDSNIVPIDDSTEDLVIDGDGPVVDDGNEPIAAEDVNDEAVLVDSGLDAGKTTSVCKPATLFVRLPRGEVLTASASTNRTHLAICPSCRNETVLDGIYDGILYTCNACKQPVFLEVTCTSCLSRSEITQDELFNAANAGIRCPVCWETNKA